MERKDLSRSLFFFLFSSHSFLLVSGHDVSTSNKRPNHLCLEIFPPGHVKASSLTLVGCQTSAGQTAYLMSEETRRAAKLSSGRFLALELLSAPVSSVSPPQPVWFCDGWLCRVSRRRVGAGVQRRGVKVRENNNQQKSRAIFGKWATRRLWPIFRDQFWVFDVSLLQFFFCLIRKKWRTLLQFRVSVPPIGNRQKAKSHGVSTTCTKGKFVNGLKCFFWSMKSHFLCKVQNAGRFNRV